MSRWFASVWVFILVAAPGARAQLNVTPSPIEITLHSGDSATIAIDLENSGGVPLDWSSVPADGSQLADVLTAFDNRFAEITSLIPDRFDFAGGDTGFEILGDDEGGMFYPVPR